MKSFNILLLLLFIFSGILAQPREGEKVIQSMFDRYHNKWYPKVTFTQQSEFYRDGRKFRIETWYEALDMPGGLVIKFNQLTGGDGIIFKSDSQFVFKDHQLVSQQPRVHELLVLGFSIYFDDPGLTAKKLVASGFNLGKVKKEKDFFVIGEEGKNQFWIERKRLLFTKLKKVGQDGTVSEIQFNAYEKLGDGWISPEVVFLKNGQIVMKELYQNIQLRDTFEKDILSVKQFSNTSW